jgi:acyl carrier protein
VVDFAKIQEVFRDVFDDEDLLVEMSTTAEDVEDWDSLSHINLVVALEKEFDVKFDLAELQKLENVGGLYELINAKKS